MDAVGAAVELVDIIWREVVWLSIGSWEDPNLPHLITTCK